MNGVTQRSHLSLRLGDVSPEVRKSLWKHALASFLVTTGTVVACAVVVWWLVG